MLMSVWFQAASSVWPCTEPLTACSPGMSLTREGADCFCVAAHAGGSIFLALAKLGDTVHGSFSACYVVIEFQNGTAKQSL